MERREMRDEVPDCGAARLHPGYETLPQVYETLPRVRARGESPLAPTLSPLCGGGSAGGGASGRRSWRCTTDAHHLPVFFIEAHGSCGGSAAPFCNSSIECLSGERTNAMLPSRGGRLMATPAFCSLSHSA